MTGTTFFPIESGAVSGPRNLFARIEKISRNKDLQNGDDENQCGRGSGTQRVPLRTPSQIDTGIASGWHAPRLSAPFVAQILGQLLAQGAPDVAAAQAAYRGTDNASESRVFDAYV